MSSFPRQRNFSSAIRPDRSDAVEVLSVDVDQLPKANGKLVQSNAIGVAIGVGTFRDSTMRGVKFAAHDAEIMGRYFQRILGIPSQQVKVLIDNHGLKDDLIEVFEQWLPKQSGPRQRHTFMCQAERWWIRRPELSLCCLTMGP